jgi:hypothetical protein
MTAAAATIGGARPSKSAIQRRLDKLTFDREEARREADALKVRIEQLESRGEEHWRGFVPGFSDPDRRMFESKIVQLEATVARSLNLLRQYRELLHRRADAR